MPADPAVTEITVAEVRALAADWARDLDGVAGAMYAYLADRIPEAHADDEIAGLTLASCTSNCEVVLSMIRHGIPASATEAPVAALEHARRMAARGVGIDATLRFYRLGHAYFWQAWSAALVEAVPNRDRLVVAMRETAAFVFDYIDLVSSRVAQEHVAERERRQRRAAVVRADVVRALLEEEDVDRSAAERALGHHLRGGQLAFVCWTPADSADPEALDAAAHAVADVLGSPRPLLLADGPDALGGWVGVSRRVDLAAVRAGLGDRAVHVALGEVGRGLEGFRESRRQADRTRRVVELVRLPAPSCTAYGDAALVDLLSHDLDAARAFARRELGTLAGGGDAGARVRETLLAVLTPGGSVAEAARTLGVHRNTVLQRLRRAEELLGHSPLHRPAELHAALLLAATLDPGRLE